MNILLTGANGFLGSHVVSALLARGHRVRAMVRPATNVASLHWPATVEILRADLRANQDLTPAFENIDCLIHLAAAVTGTEEDQFVSSVVGTERLLAAMAKSSCKRLALCSSFSVYDWSKIRGTLSETSPLEPPADLYARDGYAVAKLWQEKITRRLAEQNKWDLTILRPGFIWGRGNEYLACLGQQIGKLHFTIAPFARIPLTHVENCADAFAAAATDPRTIGHTYNIVDPEKIRIGKYFRQYRRAQAQFKAANQKAKPTALSIPIPYWFGKILTHLATFASKAIFHGKGKLPSLFIPCRYEARFKPLRYATQKLSTALQWKPPLNFKQALAKTYGSAPVPPHVTVAASAPVPQTNEI